MAQHDYVLDNQSGSAFRADLNSALAAIVSNNSGATAPATTYAYMLWADTSVSPALLKQRNAANNAWVTLGKLDTANLGLIPSGTAAIVDADVSASAGIGASKLSFTQSGGGTARTIESKLRDVVSVRDFGAVGDGVTNDSSAIQAAINSGARTVYIPRGTYNISSTTLTVPSYVTVLGDGGGIAGNATYITYSGSGTAISVSGTSGTQVRRASVRNLRVDLSNTAAVGIKLTSAREIIIDGVSVYGPSSSTGTSKGFYIEAQANFGTYVNAFYNCEATRCTHGIYIDGDLASTGTSRANSNRFFNCRIDNNKNGAEIRGADTIEFHGCHFETNITKGFIVSGGGTYGPIRVALFGCYLENTGDDIDAVNASTGGQGGVRLYNTRFGSVTANSIIRTDTNSASTLSEVVIASDAIWVYQSLHAVDTEASASTDNLATINGGLHGKIVTLRPAADTRDIVVVNKGTGGSGNIQLNGGANFTMDNSRDTITLIYDQNRAEWLEIGRSNWQ